MGTPSAQHHEYECDYELLCRLLEEGQSSRSPPPAAYDILCRLLEEGRSSRSPPPPAANAAPSPSPSPSPHGGAPCTSPPLSRRTPAWASAMRAFSNTLWLVIMVFVLAPLAMRSTSKEEVFLCVAIFLMSFGFPFLGYFFTWDQP